MKKDDENIKITLLNSLNVMQISNEEIDSLISTLFDNISTIVKNIKGEQ